jgi:hypothetical protein
MGNQQGSATKATDANQRSNTSASRQPLSQSPIVDYPLLQLQQVIGNRAVGRIIQTKLNVSQPGDQYEQEADREAEMVMRMPDGETSGISRSSTQIQRQCSDCASGGGICPKCAGESSLQRKPLAGTISPIIQRKCSECEEEEETLQFKQSPGHPPEITPTIAANINSLRGGGQPLPLSARRFFEPRFGYDFSSVRVHADGRDAQSARDLQARAFTIGRDVVFGAGEYAPESAAGRKLLAHELAHVVQQSHMPSTPQTSIQRQASPSASNAADARARAATELIVDDSAAELGAGQMRKSEFLSELRTTVCATANEAMAETGRNTEGCPYIDNWFDYYRDKDARSLERSLRRFAPDSARATTAREYIPIVAARVRRSVETWVKTGEITDVPDELRSAIMGGSILSALGSLASGIGSAVSSIAEGVGKGLSAIGNALFKRRVGGAPAEDDLEATRFQLGSGRSLEGNLRSRMESAYGVDFSGVRIHTDTAAQQLSDRLNARAFTIGSDIAFGSGEYQPGTLIGDALLAHELAHVVQQGAGKAANGPLTKGGAESGALEQEADVSAVGAVMSMYGGMKGALTDIGKNAMPRLRSGLRLQSCGKDLKSPRLKNNTLFEKVLDKEAVIKLGDKGPEVKRLQQLLIDLGIPLTTDFANGVFGADTESAVKKYQKSKSIPDDGIVDSVTINKLDEDFPTVSLPSNKSDPWSMPCILDILCPWNKHLVTKVLPTFDIITFDKREFKVEKWGGAKWTSDTFTSGGFRGGKKMGFLNSTTCEEMAFTIYHEGWHGQQPSTMTGVVEVEKSAYIAAEQFSIDIGIPGQGTFINKATSGTESFRTKKGGETVVNEPAAETFVKQEYGGVSSVPGESIIARVGASDVKVRRPDGTEYTRPAAPDETVRHPVTMTGEKKIDPAEWKCS